MTRLHSLLAVCGLLCCLSAKAQTDFDPSTAPSELVEGGTLDVPMNSSRQISFRITFVKDDTIFQTALLFNGAKLSIGRNNLEDEGYFHVVQRSCNDSNHPGLTCELLQITLNGRQFLNGALLNFAVFAGSSLRYISGDISVRIVDREDISATTATEDTDTTTIASTTVSSPVSQPTTTTAPELSPGARRAECREILTTEIVVPWVIVGVLGLLQLVTLGLLVILFCKRRKERNITSENCTEDVDHNSLDKSSMEGSPQTSPV